MSEEFTKYHTLSSSLEGQGNLKNEMIV